MRLIRLALVPTVVLAMAACSGDGDDKATPTTLVSPFTTGSPVDTTFTGEGSKQFCDLIESFDADETLDPKASPEQLEESLRKGLSSLEKAADVAPAEIKGDVRSIADVLGGLAASLDRIGYDFTKVSQADLQAILTLGPAATRLQAYVSRFCT